MIVGSVGCGKTTAVEEFVAALNDAGLETRLYTNILSLIEASDLSGIPVPGEEGAVQYLRPPTLPLDTDETAVVFLDEFDRCDDVTQSAALQLLLGGNIHDHKLSPNAYTVGAMNGESDILTNPLSKAALTRCATLFISSGAAGNLDSYDEWARANGISPLSRAFARFRPDLLDPYEDFEELAQYTPRTRDYGDRILRAAEVAQFETEDILLPCLAGVLTKGVAIQLLAFRDLYEKAPSATEVLANPDTVNLDIQDDTGILRTDILYALVMGVAGHVGDSRTKARAFVTFATRLPDELTALALRELQQVYPQAASLSEFTQWMNNHGHLQ